jgi:hypothetical protein
MKIEQAWNLMERWQTKWQTATMTGVISFLALGLNGITDIEVGPDGYLYILSYEGTIYRIVSEAAVTNN